MAMAHRWKALLKNRVEAYVELFGARGDVKNRLKISAEGTPNTGVAPLAVFGGHPDDEPADRVHDPWAARSATAAAVVCPRDQLSMPAEEGIGGDQGVPVTAYP